MSKINVGIKNERDRLVFLHTPDQFTIHREVERLAAMRAFALNPDRQLFVS